MAEKPTYEELERRVQELEKAESELSLAKDHLKKIFDNAQDAIFIHDLKGKILDVNGKMCRMYGLTKEEALEVTIEDVSSSEMSMEVLLERWQKVLNGEKLLFEWEARRPKDESVFNVEVSIQKISFHDKDVVLANVHDITERKRAEAANAEHYALMKEINVLAIELASLQEEVDIRDFVVNRLMRTPGARMSWFSKYASEKRELQLQRIKAEPALLKKAIQLLGNRIEEYKILVNEDIYQEIVKSTVGKIKTLNDLSFGAIPQSIGSAIQAITSVDRFIGLAHVIEGKLFGVSMLAMSADEPDPPTELLNTIAHLVAISLRRRSAEEALRESEKRYRTILNEMSEGYHEVDLAGNYTFLNDAFQNLFGYGREEMIGTNFSQYAAEVSIAKKVYHVHNEVYKTGNPVQRCEWDIIRKDGERRTLEYFAATVKDSKNIPTGFRGIVRDITDSRQAEAEKEKLQAQLLQAQKMESVGRLAGGVAHDFNNMLGVILGRAELGLQKTTSTDPVYKDLEQIFNAAGRSADITRQLLAFARKQTIAPKVIDLNHTVANMLKML
ncbi:MAG: PAS domain S-box protein, partial [Desulfobacteraceae bacterium]|nr:PAS domain S-box protein [Desulfobacteraceae bacterium]